MRDMLRMQPLDTCLVALPGLSISHQHNRTKAALFAGYCLTCFSFSVINRRESWE